MYIPKHFREESWEFQEELIKKYPLATVVTYDEKGGVIANHIPFVLIVDEQTGSKKLRAHIAKVNHQLPALREESDVLVIFQSHDSYITPSYYPSKEETHKFVPTWDFASVHIYGKPKVIDDFQFVRDQLNHLTDQQEAYREKKWKLSDAPENFLKTMQKAITGLEIDIERTECKYKFEQEKSEKDIQGVVSGLSHDNKPEMSKFVEVTNKRSA